jgi:hypothetical protein
VEDRRHVRREFALDQAALVELHQEAHDLVLGQGLLGGLGEQASLSASTL